MWFHLSGRFERFRAIGPEMIFTIGSPEVMTLRITEGERDNAEPKRLTNALVKVTYEVEGSLALQAQASNLVNDRQLESFTVEPHNVQAEIQQIRSKMATTTIRVMNLIRWNTGDVGPEDPLSDVEFAYSLDQECWSVLHSFPIFRRSRNLPIGLTHSWQANLQVMVDKGDYEPIGHDLFRAAWDARVSNPRAALVLGVAALEVGTKECISRLVPETAWLVDNLPAPPVGDLIGKFIPELLADRGNLSVFAPPRELVARVREAVEHRNTIAHKFRLTERYQKLEAALEYLWLEETLWTIDDLLSLFDIYSGMPKSLVWMRAPTKQLLINRNGRRELPEPTYHTSPTND